MQFLGKSGQITTLPLFVVGDQWDVYRPLVARVSQHALRRGGVYSGGVSALVGGLVPGVSATPLPPPPAVNRMTDRCKKITLPQLRCGR